MIVTAVSMASSFINITFIANLVATIIVLKTCLFIELYSHCFCSPFGPHALTYKYAYNKTNENNSGRPPGSCEPAGDGHAFQRRLPLHGLAAHCPHAAHGDRVGDEPYPPGGLVEVLDVGLSRCSHDRFGLPR